MTVQRAVAFAAFAVLPGCDLFVCENGNCGALYHRGQLNVISGVKDLTGEVSPLDAEISVSGDDGWGNDWAMAGGEHLDVGMPEAGRVWTFEPGAMEAELGATAGALLQGPTEAARFGASVARMGEALLVGAPAASPSENTAGAGAVYLFDGDEIVLVVKGMHAQDHLGEHVAACGDLDGDGADDWVVSAPWAGDLTGTVYAWLSKSSPATGRYTTEEALTAIPGEWATGSFGHAVTCRDDILDTTPGIPDDAAAELVIGAPYAVPEGQVGTGEVRIYADGRFDEPAQRLVGTSRSAEEYPEYFGSAVATGAFDGAADPETGEDRDHPIDLAIGAPGSAQQGYLYLWTGSTQALDDTLRLYGPKYGGSSGARFGASLLAHAFDDDGRMDLVVGAPAANPSGLISTVQAGTAVILKGGYAAWLEGEGSELPEQALEIHGERQYLRTGQAFAVFDGDADGVDDLVVLNRRR
jgi:hypothetical protein